MADQSNARLSDALAAMDEDAIQQLSYEEGYDRLQQVLAMLEQGDLPLAQSLRLYEAGVRLAAHCSRLLEEAELYVQRWQGEGELVPFDDWDPDA